MDRTAELRWFFRRPLPATVESWFGEHADEPVTRTDRYLVLPGSDALGVKVRGGTTRLELKVRPQAGEPLGLPGGITGRLEEWQRWSLPRPGITRIAPRLGLPRTRWVKVTKQRRIVDLPFRDGSGCRVEHTVLEAQHQHWTTVGLESYGPEGALVAALEAGADALFGSIDVPGGFDADLSCGYPGWLATL